MGELNENATIWGQFCVRINVRELRIQSTKFALNICARKGKETKRKRKTSPILLSAIKR